MKKINFYRINVKFKYKELKNKILKNINCNKNCKI